MKYVVIKVDPDTQKPVLYMDTTLLKERFLRQLFGVKENLTFIYFLQKMKPKDGQIFGVDRT